VRVVQSYTGALRSRNSLLPTRRTRVRKHNFSSSSNGDNQSHYFVDTNILVYAANKTFPKLNEFIEKPSNFFYYTDTVKTEFNNGYGATPPKFRFVPALLGNSIKNLALDKLKVSFRTAEELNKFKSDLFIIFEAGYVCYDVIPFGEHPVLLTNNMKLYRTFISNPHNNEQLAKVIELCGMEHLIDVKSLFDIGIDTRE